MNQSEYRVMAEIMDAQCACWGVAAFDELKPYLIDCSAKKRLPEKAVSVLVGLFPYYTGGAAHANLSKYAMPRDYHLVVGEILAGACEKLRLAFPGSAFSPFCDASPLPEVRAAALAGLGCVGCNGLLINAEYGSYVFIGEIVTDLFFAPDQSERSGCSACGVCAQKCPAGAIANGRVDEKKCLSAVTQTKRELTDAEKSLLKRTGMIWGCDVCQDVCPMNQMAKITPIQAFRSDLVTRLTRGEIADSGFTDRYRNRAFLWRGAKVLNRNICIIENTSEDNITGKSSHKGE